MLERIVWSCAIAVAAIALVVCAIASLKAEAHRKSIAQSLDAISQEARRNRDLAEDIAAQVRLSNDLSREALAHNGEEKQRAARSDELLSRMLQSLEGVSGKLEIAGRQTDYLSTISERLWNIVELERLQAIAVGEDAVLDRYQKVKVIGVRGDNGRVLPVKVVSSLDDAVEIKLGNTTEELKLSSWRPHSKVTDWKVAAGNLPKSVFVASRTGSGAVTYSQAAVPKPNYALGFDYDYGLTKQDNFRSDVVVQDSFEFGDGQWVSYAYTDYIGGGNGFYPVTREPAGGAEGAYVWSDSSRWSIDTPEKPHSVLAYMVYTRWLGCKLIKGNLGVSLALRGKDLRLNDGKIYLWVTSQGSRFHYRAQDLRLAGDDWTRFDIKFQPSGWEWSWSRSADASRQFDPAAGVDSFGISFSGFQTGKPPTGVLAMDELQVRSDTETACVTE